MDKTINMVDQSKFLDAMRCLASGVTVVTTAGEAGTAGMTISAMCSLSAEPPSILICVNKCSGVLDLIKSNGAFCVNILGKQHRQVADVFAGRVEKFKEDRFSCADWHCSDNGLPVLSSALVSIESKVDTIVPYGSHEIIIGKVLDIEINQQSPLLYQDRGYKTILEDASLGIS